MWGQVLISALKGLSWRLGTAGVRSLLTMLTGSSCLLAVPYLLFAPLPYGAAASFASNPIFLLGGSGDVMSWRMASKTTLNCSSYFFSSSSNFLASSSFEASMRRNFTNALMMRIFTSMALSLLRTEDSPRITDGFHCVQPILPGGDDEAFHLEPLP